MENQKKPVILRLEHFVGYYSGIIKKYSDVCSINGPLERASHLQGGPSHWPPPNLAMSR